ncbi:MAG: hypothetical protein ACPGWR_33685, partial [Ardenticatenaceae bacterium]
VVLEEKPAESKEPPLLFRLSPSDTAPGEGEKELIRELEERAIVFKKLHAQEQSANAAQFFAIREALLPDLEAAGLFSSAYCEEKQVLLEKWGCDTLLKYHKDAMRLLNHSQIKRKSPTTQKSVRWPVLRISISSDEPLPLRYA